MKTEEIITRVKNIFAWIFSIFVIFSGIIFLFDSALSGILFFLAGLIILPPFNKMLENKTKLKLNIWFKVIIVFVLLFFAVSVQKLPDGGSNNSQTQNIQDTTTSSTNTQIAKQNTGGSSEEVLETLIISCDGPAGESFPLFKGAESYDITSGKITCKKPVEILKRTCVVDVGEYTLEMDKVKQGGLVGWAMRKDLKCNSIYCDSALDSICNERN